MTDAAAMLHVEVAYAEPHRQKIIALDVEEPCTVAQVIERSGIRDEFPALEQSISRCGIFGTPVPDPAHRLVRDGDRIEIYRELLIDPKAVRKQRADTEKKVRRPGKSVEK